MMNDELKGNCLSFIILHSAFIVFFGGLPKMFCPKCGQQQADDVRFCSRCGFPLAGVNELIARGGQLPVWPVAESSVAQGESPKRKGLRQGGGMMLIATFLIPMLAILHKLLHLPGDVVLFGVLLFM